MIAIYKQSNNGEVGVLSNCSDPDDFMRQLAEAVYKYLEHVGSDPTYCDKERDLSFLLPNAFDIMCKLKGYKADRVAEQRMLFAGDKMPSANEVADVTVS